MAEQIALFHESIHDAIGTAIKTLGGPKVVAAMLWPTLKPDTGRFRLNHCLSDEHPEKLAPEEVLAIAAKAKEKGDHSIMTYLAAELGYEVPRPVTPQDQATELQRAFIEAVQQSSRIAERLTRLGVKVA